MAIENQNSNQQNKNQNNADYGQQAQSVFDELTQEDEQSGFADALRNAKVSHEESVFDNDDDLYDDEYNYMMSDEEEEEEQTSEYEPTEPEQTTTQPTNNETNASNLTAPGQTTETTPADTDYELYAFESYDFIPFYYWEPVILDVIPLYDFYYYPFPVFWGYLIIYDYFLFYDYILPGDIVVFEYPATQQKPTEVPENDIAGSGETVVEDTSFDDSKIEGNENLTPAETENTDNSFVAEMETEPQKPKGGDGGKTPAEPENTTFDVNEEPVLDDIIFDDDKISAEATETENGEEAESSGMDFGSVEPISGVVFDNIEVAKGGGTSLEGTADLNINIPQPEITGEAAGLSITLDPATKEIAFSAPSLTLNTPLGDMEVSELTLENGELKAAEAHFTFDSTKTELGALISGEAENEVSNLFALGVVVEITAHNIAISKEKGIEIESMEKQLTDLKLRLFGEDFEYDAEAGQATLHKEYSLLEFLTGQKKAEKEIKVELFKGAEVNFKTILESQDAATLDIVIEKPADDYEFTITGDFGGLSLSASAEGKASFNKLGIKAQGDISASGNIAPEVATVEGKGAFKAEPNSGIITPEPSSFDLNTKIIMPVLVNLLMNFSASFLMFSKEGKKEIKDHELAKFDVDKSFNKTFGPEEQGDIEPDELLADMQTAPIMSVDNFKNIF